MVSLMKGSVNILAFLKKVNKKSIKRMCVCVGCSSHLCMDSLCWIFLCVSCDGGRTSFFLTSNWGRVWTATLDWEREKGRVKKAAFILVEVLCCVYRKLLHKHYTMSLETPCGHKAYKTPISVLVMKYCNIELVVCVYVCDGTILLSLFRYNQGFKTLSISW